jgi:hypothetical protein
MTACFTETPDATPYAAIPARIPLDEPNAPKVKALRSRETGSRRRRRIDELRRPGSHR